MNNIYNIDIDKLKRTVPTSKVYSVGSNNDGSAVVRRLENEEEYIKAAHTVSYLDTMNPKDEVDLINAYRELAKASDVDEAIKEIVNETFSGDGVDEAFQPAFKPDSKISKATQDKILESFKYVYHTLLDWDNKGQAIFRQFYVDGKITYHIAVDKAQKEIKHLQPLDPIQIRRFKEEYVNQKTGLVDLEKTKHYYYYVPVDKASTMALKTLWNHNNYQNFYYRFDDVSVAYSDSGIVDQSRNVVLSNLFKAIIPYNNLKMMEEAMMIYRIVRAPERRAFYVDVGSLGTSKAMQYVNDIKNTFNNKTVFDSTTNSFINKKSVHSMVEDYYLPRRDGQKGTEIQTLGGAENLGVTQDIEYLKDKFYRSLNVPIGRLNAEAQQSMLLLGRVSEMQRDEYRFKRFIDTLRASFMPFIEKILMTDLLLKGVTDEYNWKNVILKDLYWDYKEDNSFTEIKKNEKIRTKLELLDQCSNHVGTYISKKWVMREVLGLTDAEIKEMEDEIADGADDEGQDDNGEATGNWG